MSWFHDLFINDVKGSLSGVGSNSAIIDVLELPTENIQRNVLYRYITATFMSGFNPAFEFTCKCIDSLPPVGEPATDVTLTNVYAYHNLTDNSLNGYVNQELSMALGVPVGWYPAEALCQAAGVEFTGIYTTYQEAGIYLLVDYDICTYENAWVSMKSVGMAGTGFYAEVFNGNHNTASGIFSHAEGAQTTASGDHSHAEGAQTTASHDSSHAEGSGTTTSGDYQHVQGRYNIVDDDAHNYAHIVGNGSSDKRSNAHTLDWYGNAWYAGSVECTKTILKSPNGTRYEITVGDDGTVKATAI